MDGSRRVSFKEFSALLRDVLKISTSILPLTRLHALWNVLDEDGSGYVDAGELSRFMRIGRPEAGMGSRTRVTLQKQSERKAHIAAQERRSGAALTKYIEREEVPPASEAELARLSTLFNAQMAAIRPRDAADGRNFYRLFVRVHCVALPLNGSLRC